MDILISGSMHMYAKGPMFTRSASQWVPLQYQPCLVFTFTSYDNTFISILVILLLLLINSDTVEINES